MHFISPDLVYLKKKGLVSICIVYLAYFKSETPLNISTSDQQDSVKTPNFETYDYTKLVNISF